MNRKEGQFVVAALASAALATALVQTPTPTSKGVTTSSYTVQSGDSMWKISQATGASLDAIEQQNPLTKAQNLVIGETLQIPEDHSTLTLQERLAHLGYLPLTDTLQWAYVNVPLSLKYLWQPGSVNVMTKGAVMQFQADNGLPTDGVAGPVTWNAITQALVENFTNPDGYSYVYVSNTSPFTLYLWNQGKYVLTSLANLGIPESQTVMGTYPIYLQYQSQEMKGSNPDGSTYDDYGVPYVSYFYRGEAIHGFPRATYGSQQSLGCVELPFAQAQTAWQFLHIGTLVTIDN